MRLPDIFLRTASRASIAPAAFACTLGVTAVAAAFPPVVAPTGQPPVSLATGTFAVRELSGLTWTGGDEYLAIGDNGLPELWKLVIAIDPLTGGIDAATVVGSLAVPGLASDGEGIAFLPARRSVAVSDEASSSIREFRVADGALLGVPTMPPVFLAPNLRANLGLESLGAAPGEVWTANEEALASDGPVSTTSAGTLVRIQRFTQSFAPSGQWAYRTDPISALTPLVDLERSGVVEVLPIGDSKALVLERELGGSFVPDFRSRLYAVDAAGADDVSARPSLAKGGFTPLAKALLWQGDFALANFEGMAIGPTLADGCRSLVLVSDDGGGSNGQQMRLVALRICGLSSCEADLDGSGSVDGGDLASMLGSWGDAGPAADLDQDGVVSGGDLAILLGAWGACGP